MISLKVFLYVSYCTVRSCEYKQNTIIVFSVKPDKKIPLIRLIWQQEHQAEVSFLPGNTITWTSHQITLWALTDITASSDLGVTLDSITANVLGYSQARSLEDNVTLTWGWLQENNTNSHKCAYWNPVTSACRHRWHAAYRCHTLPPVPQGRFACFTGWNCLCA